ncbi:hypothetical protein PQQ86_32545 [Paraburkholderia sediminicola]|uniref:hypothetical protein n=1 Tax=Paraburkholderia sediminicola TaxID=458836 RepID=UPI0038BDD7A9
MSSSKSEMLAVPPSGIQASSSILAGAAETGRASNSSPQKVTQQEFAEVSQQLELKMQNLRKSEKAREKAAIEERNRLTSLSKKQIKPMDRKNQLAQQNEIINDAKGKAEKANQAAVMFAEYGRKGDKYVLRDGSNDPVGVMSMDVDHDSKAVKIETIATDPGTSGNGGRLIAHAVNESQKRGMQGVVTLVDVSANQQHGHDGGQNIYAHIGFKPVDGEPGKMILNPGESDSWKKDADTWGRARSIQRVPKPQST